MGVGGGSGSPGLKNLGASVGSWTLWLKEDSTELEETHNWMEKLHKPVTTAGN